MSENDNKSATSIEKMKDETYLKSLEYLDRNHNIFHFNSKVGEGGQGVVFRTDDDDYAIKLSFADNNNFERLRILPLSDDLNISLPISLLMNQEGYVMRLLKGFKPLSSFFPKGEKSRIIFEGEPTDSVASNEKIFVKTTELPSFFRELTNRDMVVFFYLYRKHGASLKKMSVFANAAAVLAKLHARGLVYVDISDSNIFYNDEDDTVWFIDGDNINYLTRNGVKAYITPGFAAPELVNENFKNNLSQRCGYQLGATHASDVYAFLVTAFKILSGIHPFDGQLILTQENNDFDDDFDDVGDNSKQFTGELPWVDDKVDSRNISPFPSIPREIIFTEEVVKLFNQNFTDGKFDLKKRPSAEELTRAFAQNSDVLLECPKCGFNYLSKYVICAFCDSPNYNVVNCETYAFVNKEFIKEPIWRFSRNFLKNKLSLPVRLFKFFTVSDMNKFAIDIEINNGNVEIKKNSNFDEDIFIAIEHEDFQNGKFLILDATISYEWKTDFCVYFRHSIQCIDYYTKCSFTKILNKQ